MTRHQALGLFVCESEFMRYDLIATDSVHYLIASGGPWACEYSLKGCKRFSGCGPPQASLVVSPADVI
jgi:hypothetical protein